MKTIKRKISEEEINFSFNSVGFQFPQTEKELNAFENLYSDYHYRIKEKHVNVQSIIDTVKNEEDSKNKKKEQPNKTYFKRVVLAAEVAKNFYDENTFGHVKFQKLMYLCEYATNMQLNERYCKQVAGPYDSKFMHSIDKELKRLNWFDVQRDKNSKFPRFIYIPLDGLAKQEEYFNNYFPDDKNIKYIIQLFKYSKTEFVELVATLYACIIEAKASDGSDDLSIIKKKFYEWSKEKKKFSEIQIYQAIVWMKEKMIYPK
jgi:hypothetical protein